MTLYFIPEGYPHHIENLTDEEMRFLIFFDQTTPEDIGFTSALSAFPRRIIAPTLGCREEPLPLARFGQCADKDLPIQLVPDEGLPAISTRQYMIKRIAVHV